MENFISGINPVFQALLGTLFTWFMTALGAAVVFLGSEISRLSLTGCWDLREG